MPSRKSRCGGVDRSDHICLGVAPWGWTPSAGGDHVLTFAFEEEDDELGAGAYIVGVVDHPYLATQLPLWLTLSSYASTTPVVLTVRDAFTGEGTDLIYIRSVVRLLGYRPYLCQVGRTTTGAPIPASDQLTVLGRSRRWANCPKER
ncbi:hypothetical protein B296_00051483 [Ensete ventricosum]|uniref:Uncharacterized protein n=1 Tax=Ensete ventricosum TaxID=4639 RepID=A0A426XFN9_ENSVE|nr:hypothetical protein B296_00051483 [Ensete ventricosum]